MSYLTKLVVSNERNRSFLELAPVLFKVPFLFLSALLFAAAEVVRLVSFGRQGRIKVSDVASLLLLLLLLLVLLFFALSLSLTSLSPTAAP